jgi:methanogenic corrinoid protein MtbC1
MFRLSTGTNRVQKQSLQDYKSKANIDDEPCGQGIDWSKGVRGLSVNKSKNSDSLAESALVKVIEAEIIPNLFLAHRDISPPTTARLTSTPRKWDTSDFAKLVLSADSEQIVLEIESLLAFGIPIEKIYLDLLAPVARQLGKFWEEDRCTFTDVTLGLARMHQVLHEISRRSESLEPQPNLHKHRAYLIPVPGEQHTFGLSMLEEFFLHAGWETASNHAVTADEIGRFVVRERLDIIGFSVSCKAHMHGLNEVITRTRRASKNRQVTILVGGRVFLDHPELEKSVSGATVVADGVRAVKMAENLLAATTVSGQSRPILKDSH